MNRRAIGILTSLAVVCGGAVVLQSRAADESDRAAVVQPFTASPGSHAQPTKAPSTDATPAPAKAAGGKSPAAKPSVPGAPQVPEESATIRDDPTIAPDPKQSADNNVSFPNDI
jgi:hypothetical protein